MTCSACGKPEAVNKVSVFVNGKHQDILVCDECLQKLQMDAITEVFPLLLLPLLGMPEAARKDFIKEQERKATEENCTECFEIFRTFILPMIQSIHRTYHTPKIEKKKSKADELQGNLNKALREERYEDAAKIRDEIKNLGQEKPPETTPI